MTAHSRLLPDRDKMNRDPNREEPPPGSFGVEADRPGGRRKFACGNVLWQGLLLIAVVLFGCGNNISKQIASVSLSKRYAYMLGLSTAVAYVPLFWAILLVLLQSGAAPMYQLRYMWQRNGYLPPVLLIVLAALGDALGDVIGAICTSHVSGPVHSLLSNCTSVFVALLSMCLLNQRYSFFQLSALAGVFLAVVIGILPSFQSSASGSNPFFAMVLGSCIFNAVAFVVKELIFTRYKTWRADQDLRGGSGLNIFLINSHEAVFQLPLTLMLIPLNDLLKQSSEGNIFSYLKEAMHCVFSGEADACGPEAKHGEAAGLCLLVYVVFNLLWNMGILLSVKHTGALATFVALKAIFPVSTVLFEYVDWPLLGKKDFSWLIWLSMAILLPSIACYQWASQLQAARAAIHPSLASCCWPWRQKMSNFDSEMMLG